MVVQVQLSLFPLSMISCQKSMISCILLLSYFNVINAYPLYLFIYAYLQIITIDQNQVLGKIDFSGLTFMKVSIN